MLVSCHAFHIVEEYAFDLPGWARTVGVSVSWPEFHTLNAAFLLFGICAAAVAWDAPAFALALPAHLLLNAAFHGGATIVSGHFNPGLATSLLLFVPLSVKAFREAQSEGILTRRVFLTSLAMGVGVHSLPLFYVLR